VAELADAADSKSAGDHSPCGFDSLLRDQCFSGDFNFVYNIHEVPANNFC
jgi:hypothetical protein